MYIIIQFRTTSSIPLFGSKEKMYGLLFKAISVHVKAFAYLEYKQILSYESKSIVQAITLF